MDERTEYDGETNDDPEEKEEDIETESEIIDEVDLVNNFMREFEAKRTSESLEKKRRETEEKMKLRHLIRVT